MEITIISVINNDQPTLDRQQKLILELNQSGHRISLLEVDQLEIKSCTGCWGCWVKTPGKCFIQDDMEQILKSMINSDLTIFYSPLIMGFVPGKMKITMDRTIPLVHPYIVIVQKECHHKKRYNKYPQIGMIISGPQNIENEEKELIQKLFKRYALNLQSTLRIFADSTISIQEISHEINHI